ncbi:MAG: hypothetical protein GY720_09625 [bacterium]|nr:hypothetical protein [bacterium]
MAVRRVRRIIRRFDPWTVLKVSLVFNAITATVFVLGLWVMWSLLLQKGIPASITDLFDQVKITFVIDGETWGRVVIFLAIVWTIAATAAMTLGAVLYNLIADLVGGVELTVLEESYVQPAQTTAPVRPARRPSAFGRLTSKPGPATGNGGANGAAASRSEDPKPITTSRSS